MMKNSGLILVVICLAFFTAHGIYSAKVNSVTADEYVHLPVGYSVVKTGDMEMDHTGSPPVARAILALPLLFTGAELNLDNDAWKRKETYPFSWLFMKDNFKRYASLYFLPRVVGVIFGILLILGVRAAAMKLYGRTAALAAVFLLAFSPELLAHSPLVTTDMIGAGFFLPPFSYTVSSLKSPA